MSALKDTQKPWWESGLIDAVLEAGVLSPSEYSKIKNAVAEIVVETRKKDAESVQRIFAEYWPEVRCVPRVIADNGTMQRYTCYGSCGNNPWDESTIAPVCRLSRDLTPQKALKDIATAILGQDK